MVRLKNVHNKIAQPLIFIGSLARQGLLKRVVAATRNVQRIANRSNRKSASMDMPNYSKNLLQVRWLKMLNAFFSMSRSRSTRDSFSRRSRTSDSKLSATGLDAAAPRRTRRTPRGYLATWLDWISNRKGESIEAFLTRALKSDGDPLAEGGGALGWTIESRSNWGQLPEVRRNVGTVQKDWAYVKSNALPDDLCIAVRGHQGWSRDPDAVARYTLVVTFEIVGQEIPIYLPLRTAVLELRSEVEAEVELELELDVEP